RDAPLEPGGGTGNAEVAFELLDGIAQFTDAEIGNDQRLAALAPGIDEIEQPLLVVAQAEVKVFLFAKLHRLPLRTEFAVFAPLLVRKELFLTHGIISALAFLVDPLALAVRPLVVPKPLENGPDAVLVTRRGRRGPAVIADVQLFPEGDEFRG